MARIRTIKPEFFRHEALQELETQNPGDHCLLVFAALWTQSDKNGVFEWRPRQLKLDILPFIQFDMEATLELLRAAEFIECYQVDAKEYGRVPTFIKNQRITGKEAESPGRYPLPGRGIIGETPEKQPRSKRDKTDVQEREREVEKEKEKEKELGKGARGETEPSPPPPEGEPLFSLEPKTADTRRTLPTQPVSTSSFDGRVFLSIPAEDGTSFDITNAGVAELIAEYPKLDVRGVLLDFAGMCKEQPKFRLTKQVITDSLKQHLPRINDFYNGERTIRRLAGGDHTEPVADYYAELGQSRRGA
jgi:hypothetical protein